MEIWDERFNDHDVKLTKLETVLERVDNNQSSMADSISSIAISMQKQELLLEKITNLEVNTRNSFDRVHSRIDVAIEDELNRFKVLELKLADKEEALRNKLDASDSSIASKFKSLNPILVLLENKKLAILSAVGIYAMAIKDFRDPVLQSVIGFLLKIWG